MQCEAASFDEVNGCDGKIIFRRVEHKIHESTQQVIYWYPDDDSISDMTLRADNCIVRDRNNWSCNDMDMGVVDGMYVDGRPYNKHVTKYYWWFKRIKSFLN